MMGATDRLLIAVSHSVSFMGKTWWMLMLVCRLVVLLLAGFTLFSDEQERFICNTIQPGCSNVCFDIFAPVSIFRLWIFHLLLLFLPHVLFATYIMHKVLLKSYPTYGGSFSDRSRGGSPFQSSSSSREMSLHRAEHEWGVPRFYCSYLLVVTLRILLEVVFGAGQFFLFGLSIPKSFLCYEAPCTSGVECYISKPTEKTLMLNFMLCVSTLSVLLSFFDLVSSMKAMVRWRTKREMLIEEMSKGEQSSVFTTTTTEDSEVLLTRRISLVKDEKQAAGAVTKTDESHDDREDKSLSPTPMSAPAAAPFVLHSHMRPPMSPRPDKIPPQRVATPMGVRKQSQSSPAVNSGQQSDSSDSQDRRAWV